MTKRYPAQRRFDAKYDQTRPKAITFRLDEIHHEQLESMANEGESANQVAKRLLIEALSDKNHELNRVEVGEKPV